MRIQCIETLAVNLVHAFTSGGDSNPVIWGLEVFGYLLVKAIECCTTDRTFTYLVENLDEFFILLPPYSGQVDIAERDVVVAVRREEIRRIPMLSEESRFIVSDHWRQLE